MATPIYDRPIWGVAAWRFVVRLVGVICLLFAFLMAQGNGRIIFHNDTAAAWFGIMLCWISTL